MSDKVKALRVLATGLYSDGSENDAQSVEAIALYVENLESSLAALREENERLKGAKKNYLETILAIREMGDIDRARQWCKDTLYGCEPLEATLLNLQNESDQLKARVAELERGEPITAILAYKNKGYRGVCGATVGADGQGIYAVVYRGLSFDAASNHARNLIRELDASKYQIGEYLFVDAREGIAGNPISIITKEPANEG